MNSMDMTVLSCRMMVDRMSANIILLFVVSHPGLVVLFCCDG